MMKNNNILFILLLIFYHLMSFSYAQESINTSGGNAVGDDGIVNYSIGQAVTNQYSDLKTVISEGVQQPYIETISNINNVLIDHIFTVYPNLTTDFIEICTNELPKCQLNICIYDIGGNLVLKRLISDLHTKIDISFLDPGVLILSLQDEDTPISQFKIIKYK